MTPLFVLLKSAENYGAMPTLRGHVRGKFLYHSFMVSLRLAMPPIVFISIAVEILRFASLHSE
jgi:hypothetical protein